MTRTAARESLMQMLFQMEAQNDFSEEAKIQFIQLNIEEEDQLAYFNTVFDSFVQNKEQIDSLIEEYSNGWKLSRLARVDLSVLRLCLAEFKFAPEGKATPVNAAISEAVKMAKKFGSDDSGKFVNGILGKISRS